MTSDEIRQMMLDKEWTESDLREAARIMAQLERSDEDMNALRDFDRLRQLLAEAGAVDEDVEPAGGWESFESRTMARMSRRGSPRWFYRTLLAASLALAAVGWIMYLHAPAGQRDGQIASKQQGVIVNRSSAGAVPGKLPGGEFTAAEVGEQVQVFEQVSQVFDRRATWVAVSDTDSEIGLTAVPPTTDGRVLLLRLTMTRNGRSISQSDLVIVPGQSAELALPFEGGQQLHYRIGTTDTKPTLLSIWVDLAAPGKSDETLAALATTLSPRMGESLPAGRLVTSGGGYELSVGFYESVLSGI